MRWEVYRDSGNLDRSRRFAFVIFCDADDVQAVIEAMHGQCWTGCAYSWKHNCCILNLPFPSDEKKPMSVRVTDLTSVIRPPALPKTT